MSFERGSDSGPADPFGHQGRMQHVRHDVRVGYLGLGTMACPECDAPVALPPGSFAPVTAMECPYCAHLGRVRDFLTLATAARPARPARVRVRIVDAGRMRVDPV
ncbi:hypothetical protein DSM112329_05035 [Paraconexibacter sp. AEG42_29]|uniref:Zinc ribbon domain-containing protein n=1 Tax=Paraconexibacter sp. AEG42_29 TaxID=2997339 RepID=A0AAU7B2I9_9ACTN